MEQDKSQQPDEKKENLFERIKKVENLHRQTRLELTNKEKKLEEQSDRLKKYEELEKIAQSNPIKLMEILGWDYDKLTKYMLNKDDNSDINVLNEKLIKLEKYIDNTKIEKENERKNKIYEETINNIKKVVKNNEYDLIEHFGFEDNVLQYMSKMYEKNGFIPSYKKACKDVNDYLINESKKIKNSKWLKDEVENNSKQKKENSSNTISNKMTQTSSTIKSLNSEQDRTEAAISLLKSMKYK